MSLLSCINTSSCFDGSSFGNRNLTWYCANLPRTLERGRAVNQSEEITQFNYLNFLKSFEFSSGASLGVG